MTEYEKQKEWISDTYSKLMQSECERKDKSIAELEKQLEQATEIIKNIIRVTWGEGWNYSLDWKVKAEQFLKEVEK